MPSTLSCNRSRCSNSDVVECINDFSDSADALDFAVSFSISEEEELLLFISCMFFIILAASDINELYIKSVTRLLRHDRSISEQFKDLWGTYGQFIGLFAGGFVGHILKYSSIR